MTDPTSKTTESPLTPATARQLLAEVAARYRAARDQMADATDEARAIARRARGEAELTKVEIAGILDVQRPTLDRWIDGPNSPFQRRLRARIAAGTFQTTAEEYSESNSDTGTSS